MAAKTNRRGQALTPQRIASRSAASGVGRRFCRAKAEGERTMEIRQFRVVVRASDFERTCRFYGEVLALPRVQSWDGEGGRGALYQAGSGVIEILGRHRPQQGGARDERYTYQGPDHKLTITLVVPSAESTYQELIFRDKNIPGGLRKSSVGGMSFETHDPDGVRIVFRQAE
jgi:catechol 2,3-dioxygenase-like lactoylglutathione lyase family enzyme